MKKFIKINFALFGIISIALFSIFSYGCSRKNVAVMPPKQSLEIAAPKNTPVISNQKENTKNMNGSNLKTVSPGNWGATGISLIIEENGVKMEYDCAVGEIKEKLMMNENGEFEADGFYTVEGFGPVSKDDPPKPKPARYEGKISGETMTLRVTLTGSKEKIGDFTLERNKFARLRKCY